MLVETLVNMAEGWQEVIVCNKCGFTHTIGFAPSICPKCASPFYYFGNGVQSTAHKAIAKRTLFGWKFLNKDKQQEETK